MESANTDPGIQRCRDIYGSFHTMTLNNLNQTFEDELAAKMVSAHNRIDSISAWIDVLEVTRLEQLLTYSKKSLESGTYYAATSMYRAAFVCLRQASELALATALFSANEIQLRNWQDGSQDIVWDSIANLDSGVFSINFIRPFFPELVPHGRAYSEIAKLAYRECSEYVHYNPRTETADEFRFNSQMLNAWNDTATSMEGAISFALTCRFLNDLELSHRRRLEPYVLERLGHIEAVRLAFIEGTQYA